MNRHEVDPFYTFLENVKIIYNVNANQVVDEIQPLQPREMNMESLPRLVHDVRTAGEYDSGDDFQ